MALVRILMFALTLFSNTVTSQPCRRLFMQGLDNTQLLPYAELSGLYSLTNSISSGFSTYLHEIHRDQLFFYNSTLRMLQLGRQLLLAQTSGRRPSTNVQYPYSKVITGWRVYQPATKRLLFRFLLVFIWFHHHYCLALWAAESHILLDSDGCRKAQLVQI